MEKLLVEKNKAVAEIHEMKYADFFFYLIIVAGVNKWCWFKWYKMTYLMIYLISNCSCLGYFFGQLTPFFICNDGILRQEPCWKKKQKKKNTKNQITALSFKC